MSISYSQFANYDGRGGASAITFRRQLNALQVASERTTMEEAVPNRNILVSKSRTHSSCVRLSIKLGMF